VRIYDFPLQKGVNPLTEAQRHGEGWVNGSLVAGNKWEKAEGIKGYKLKSYWERFTENTED
jgi:hypothetical protein